MCLKKKRNKQLSVVVEGNENVCMCSPYLTIDPSSLEFKVSEIGAQSARRKPAHTQMSPRPQINATWWWWVCWGKRQLAALLVGERPVRGLYVLLRLLCAFCQKLKKKGTAGPFPCLRKAKIAGVGTVPSVSIIITVIKVAVQMASVPSIIRAQVAYRFKFYILRYFLFTSIPPQTLRHTQPGRLPPKSYRAGRLPPSSYYYCCTTSDCGVMRERITRMMRGSLFW